MTAQEAHDWLCLPVGIRLKERRSTQFPHVFMPKQL
jgi:hypothetical protein